ncbi:MAG: 30S ribosomal protein S13 [Euryarchaeota archaeon]|nr:30S ribosomal protein S13 [Euryarchaeota archaeon]
MGGTACSRRAASRLLEARRSAGPAPVPRHAENGNLKWEDFSGGLPPLGGGEPLGGRTSPKNEKGEDAPEPGTKAAPAAGPAAGAPKEGGKKPKEGKEGGKSEKGGEKKAAKAGPPEKKTKKVSDNPNFRYIVRVANTDLDGTRPTVMALTKIPGVGVRIAEATARVMGLNAAAYIGDLTEEQTDAIETTLLSISERLPPWMLNRPMDRTTAETHHLVSADLETAIRDDINLMKMIRCYKGIRHERGQKVRGQRTRSNGRTGMAAGVLKKAAKDAAAGAKGAGGKEEKK